MGRFEGVSPETRLTFGEILLCSVHRTILNCYLLRLEYIFNPKPLQLFLLVFGILKFYRFDRQRNSTCTAYGHFICLSPVRTLSLVLKRPVVENCLPRI